MPRGGLYWTEELIVDAIQAYVREHGSPPKYDAWEAATPFTPCAYVVRRRFGSWNAALEAAGFAVRPRHRSVYWTRERCLEAFRAWGETHGRSPTMDEWRVSTLDTPTPGTIIRRFGSWSAAQVEAGFPARGRHPISKWTRDTIADAMLAALMRDGRWPTFNEWRCAGHGKRPNAETVTKMFGTWNAAKRYAGWDPDAASRPIPVASECRGCGAERGVVTTGCKTCHDRKRKREKWRSDAAYREQQKSQRIARRERTKNGSIASPTGSSLRVPRSSADGESASGGGAVTPTERVA